ncbi:L7Ae/L30e/S12e/Gadd45 family ribosomal protein [Lactobacillus sp. PV034]|uniref:L7Ae/L30e/S12e/Gadd45 family ribosomal protein n=1 Tax=Lactobacillus sp. PV034 TaxID=2594495 RepID=UPI00223FE0CD|nr:ribosomal L7Ae/L30e/S12e/Gadd45 family protein [Lactobacillus sp. PV034]QNQ80333.1 50S ribosomal protein L7 [Lactobacillus sp. PV034]
MQNKILNLLGLAQRAGKLIVGYDAIKPALLHHQVKVLILATDLSNNTKDKISSIAKHSKNILIIEQFSSEEIKQALGKERKLLAITDAGFSQAIKKISDK